MVLLVMHTLSVDAGTDPPLQFPGVFQSPPATFVHVLLHAVAEGIALTWLLFALSTPLKARTT